MAANDPQDLALWDRLDELMVQIASAGEPYAIATEVGGCVLDAITESVAASRVYQVWAKLTDRYELRPDERGETEAVMREAAREWLAVKHDDAARDRYLDHWVDDDPQNWRLDVPQACVDLYLDVSKTPRPLSAKEAEMLVQLVDAWRGLEHRKHTALETARHMRGAGS